jgi:hypothetical protein
MWLLAPVKALTALMIERARVTFQTLSWSTTRRTAALFE